MAETLASLLALPVSAITAQFIDDLLDQGLRESLTLEFKEKASQRVVETIAAMANSYGGLILVGIDDRGATKGVPERVEVDVVNMCYTKLEPPVVPDMSLIRGVGSPAATVLAIRVDAQRLPRPIVVDGKVWVRLQGRNAPADRGRIRELMAAPTPGGVAGRGLGTESLPSRWYVPAGMGEEATFVVRVVLHVRAPEGWMPPVDSNMKRDLRARLDAGGLARWRAEKLRFSDRYRKAGWMIEGLNTSSQATLNLAPPEGDNYLPSFRSIVSLPDVGRYAACLFLLDAINQGEVVRRQLDEFIELCTVMIHEAITETGVPLFQNVLGTGLWIEGVTELRMECTNSQFADWLDVSRFDRFPEALDFRQTNGLTLSGVDVSEAAVRPHVVDWLKRLLLDLGYFDFEDVLDRWRL